MTKWRKAAKKDHEMDSKHEEWKRAKNSYNKSDRTVCMCVCVCDDGL